jgi:hypothetical protein
LNRKINHNEGKRKKGKEGTLFPRELRRRARAKKLSHSKYQRNSLGQHQWMPEPLGERLLGNRICINGYHPTSHYNSETCRFQLVPGCHLLQVHRYHVPLVM